MAPRDTPGSIHKIPTHPERVPAPTSNRSPTRSDPSEALRSATAPYRLRTRYTFLNRRAAKAFRAHFDAQP